MSIASTLAALAATSAVNNGGTILIDTGTAPTEGFAVSVPGAEARHVLPPDAGTLADWWDSIGRRVVDVARLLGLPVACGTWRDDQTGVWYVDVSVVAPTLHEGLTLGQRGRQLAIFDIGRGEVIRVP